MSVTANGPTPPPGNRSGPYPGADASMDDILASIRRIISEEPLSYRHRRTEADLSQDTSRFLRQRRLAPRGNLEKPHGVQATVPMVQTQVALPLSTEDSVLSELLADVTQTAPAPVVAQAHPTDATLFEGSSEAATEVVEQLTGAQLAVTDAATDPVLEERPAPFLSPPESEVRAAASVLDALAVGLAAAKVPVAPADAFAATPVTPSPPAAEEHAPPSSAVVTAQASEAEAVLTAVKLDEPAPSGTNPISADRAPPSVAVVALHSPPVIAEVSPQAAVAAPQSFESTISSMLRPLLREWLDANLPRMVENALRDELGTAGPGHPAPAPAAPASRRTNRRTAAAKTQTSPD